ncbi:serine acetyltransferase [Bradyrhizobium sp. Ce-3]|uniref:serine O-acetyltransferase n=1 Tax=Bradyrhizobium sp. Ce-3 TaxID=2913970 RepID=UPI001FC7D294|nr:serine acetyltransferase [Bradyrhizobium sp. Ce-3]GKQ51935.1 serine acetyltransferase [Bradyrhizobium sp. Ce-3]
MTGSATAHSDDLWRAIRREAEAAVVADPFLEAAAAFILDQGEFGGALAFLIGRAICRAEPDRAPFMRVAREAYAAEPALIDAAAIDLAAIVRRDPAITGFLPPFLNFKGYVALQAWRVSNWLWREDRPDLALMMHSAAADQLQISIHPSARIGTAVFLDHGTGIIIGARASVGDEVTILQNVTIARHQDDPCHAPTIGHGVLLSAGATVIGHLKIGDFARIGAGALVTSDVPAGCTAVGVPARLTNCAEAGASTLS